MIERGKLYLILTLLTIKSVLVVLMMMIEAGYSWVRVIFFNVIGL